ncbi:HET domain-containing protein [Fusarium sp. LHS14.1]|nr:HET domain-containing protein [Fusarium sp. LHS14.1]
MDLSFILNPVHSIPPDTEKTRPQNSPYASANNATYSYTPLKYPDEIRLLIIEPGRPSEAVKCNLVHTRLSHTPSYEALSYTWGTEEKPGQISCGHEGQISVTQNCFHAIKRLRYKDHQRVTWVDAVCIDQPSIAERGHQVAIMPSIYRQAKKVIVYLGESTEDSGIAMEYLKSHEFINDDATSFSLSHSQLALRKLLLRPWFSRLRVLQEIFMSTSTDVICGHKSVPWACFRRLAKWNPQSSLQKIPLVMSVNSHRTAQEPYIQDFFSLLCNTRDCGCKDPRDRIFALFSMGPEDLHKRLNIDYQESTETVFTNTAIYLINCIGLDALCGVGGREVSSSLPSWVPDWRIPVGTTPMMDLVDEAGSAGGRRHDQVFQFFNSHRPGQQTVLQTFGCHFGNVESLGDIVLSDRSNLGHVISQGWKDFTGNETSNLQSLIYRESFFRTLYMDAKTTTSWAGKRLQEKPGGSFVTRYYEGYESWISNVEDENYLPELVVIGTQEDKELYLEKNLEQMVDAWDKLKQELSCESFPFAKRKRLYSCCTGRRLCKTQKSFIGLFPAQTQLDDQIYILRGARCLLVLRREHDRYVMVGPCFVWEAMARRSSRAQFMGIDIW